MAYYFVKELSLVYSSKALRGGATFRELNASKYKPDRFFFNSA